MAAQTSAARMQRSARRFRIYAYFAAALAMLCVASELLLALSPAWHGGDVRAALWAGLGQLDLAVPVFCFVWSIWRARRLFRRIEEGEVFGPQDSRDFVWIGRIIVAGAVWSLTLGGLVTPQTGKLAEELAGLGIGARDLASLALGFALVAVGHVVAQARRLKVDNDSFL
jgi:hypothetical protein